MSVAFVNTNTPIHGNFLGPPSGSMTVNSGGSNVVAFATVEFGGTFTDVGTLASATLGGVSMTSVGSPANNTGGTGENAQIFYLINPTSGTLTISVASGQPWQAVANLVVFQGVDQRTPVRPGTYTTNTGTSANPTLTVTSNISDVTITSVATNNRNTTVNSTNQTSDGIDNALTACRGGSDHCTTPAASVTHTWTIGGANAGSVEWAIAGLSIQESFGPNFPDHSTMSANFVNNIVSV
jgi:hypothetical protein